MIRRFILGVILGHERETRWLVACALGVGFCLAAIASARAEDGRKVDFSFKIVNQYGEPLSECLKLVDPADGSKGCALSSDLTLGHLAMTALNQPDGALKSEDFTRRMKLGLKVLDAKELELSVDEIKLIKDAIEKLGQPQQRLGGAAMYSPLVVYRAQQSLDPVGTK